jgi:hypothetical protein
MGGKIPGFFGRPARVELTAVVAAMVMGGLSLVLAARQPAAPSTLDEHERSFRGAALANRFTLQMPVEDIVKG